MRLSHLARSLRSTVALLGSGLLFGACGDISAPRATEAGSIDAESPFSPSAASRALVGVTDGTYRFSVDPTRDESLRLGANLLHIPANAVCNRTTSSYGSRHWNDRCVPETARFMVTAVVTGAATDSPRIDFHPALRFSPTRKVNLFMYMPDPAQQKAARNWSILYCNDANLCVDESLTDRSLRTHVDKKSKVAYRQIKHFSGFILNAGFADELTDPFAR
ncbi:MAG: hypothetical protein JWL60_203 [Gemmatimonadetes bacterium]|jgi:hypothetical protein|nr:hypothetical protein [Gemmatimonadota bacterium]